jgi:hypothetical protein
MIEAEEAEHTQVSLAQASSANTRGGFKADLELPGILVRFLRVVPLA